MKKALQNIFSPILKFFENGEEEFTYKESQRTILIIVGVLFFLLSFISFAVAIFTAQLAAVFPILIFFSAGSVCFIVGGLGSNHAVAKLWGNK